MFVSTAGLRPTGLARCSGCSVLIAVVAADSKPARLDVSANGPLGRELRFEGKLAAGPIDAGGKGTLRFASDQPATLDFDQFAGMIGGNNVQGRGTLRFDDVLSIDGSIEAESLDAPAVVAAAIGMPSRSGAGGTGWSPDPIAWSATGLNGRIAFKAQRAVFAPWLVAQGSAAWCGSTVRRSCSRISRANWAKAASTGVSPLPTAPPVSPRGFASGSPTPSSARSFPAPIVRRRRAVSRCRPKSKVSAAAPPRSSAR